MIVWITRAMLSTDFYLKTFNLVESARACKRFAIKPFSALEKAQLCLEVNSTKYDSQTRGVKEAIPENSLGEVGNEAGLRTLSVIHKHISTILKSLLKLPVVVFENNFLG